MSDNYKVIRKSKEVILDLLHKDKWSTNQIVKTAGITHNLVKEITTQDPVGIKVWDITIEKLRTFNDKYDKGIDKPVRRGSKVRIVSDGKHGFDVHVPPSMRGAIPVERGIDAAPGADKSSGNDLMDELNALGSKFKMKGWNLEARLSKIFIP